MGLRARLESCGSSAARGFESQFLGRLAPVLASAVTGVFVLLK